MSDAPSTHAPPLTTVVVNTYNYARFLEAAVDSVVHQTRRPHIIVVDDASTDETAIVAERLVSRYTFIKYDRLRSNIGLARVRNLAAGLATTRWIMFLDADDWLDSRYVERGERWLADRAQVDVLTTDMTIMRDRRPARVVKSRLPTFWNDLLERNTIAQTSFIRRSLVTELGGYDPSLDFEDWDFWIRALQAGKCFARLPGAHVFRREHGRNKSKLCDERAATARIRAKHDSQRGQAG